MKRLLVLAALTAMLGAVAPAAAAPATGMSYEEVMKFAMGGDASTLQPGDFDSDFQTASQPAPAPKGGGGMFGGISAAMQQAAGAMAMFKTGIATRHYVAGTKERVDYPAMQQATITDCGARTITKLDLKNKTYTVTSMDHPITPSAGRGRPSANAPSANDDGSKVAIALSNQALGPRTIAGITTDGYQSNVAMTVTRPNGDTGTSNMALTEYLARMSAVSLVCPAAGMLGAQGAAAMGMGQYAALMRAMTLSGKDPRFTMSATGPALPTNRFSLFLVVTISGQGRGGQSGSFAIASQRAHVASVRSDDGIFQVPADFTKAS
jgi:hypothetical protein